MLQAIRDKAGSLVVKILFILLIASFAIWGIGDIFRNRSGETVIAKVGDRKIRADEFQVAVREEVTRLRSLVGTSLDMAQAKQFGVVDQVLDRLIARQVMELEDQRLGLSVGDDAIRQVIQNDPSFRGPTGGFDRTLYNHVLANNRMSETQYEGRLRREMAGQHLIDGVTSGVVAPAALADVLYATRNEKRVADFVFLPLASAGDVPEPTDEQLAEVYDRHQEDFRAPEYRGFTALVLGPEAVSAGIEVPDDRLRQEYDARAAEFTRPERRDLQQMILPTQEKADEAEKLLQEGKSFEEVAKTVADQNPDQTKLGWTPREEMPAELADAAFSAETGKPTAPVAGPFGWQIMLVNAVEPGGQTPFEEVKDKIKAEVVKDLAADQLYKVANEVEDALAGGITLEDAAKKVGVEPVKVESVDPNGRTASGEPAKLPEGAETLLRTAFDTAKGQTSRMAETQGGSFLIVRVDAVTPSVIRPREDVKDKLAALWRTEKQTEAVDAKAKQMAEAAKDKALADLAKEQGLEVKTTSPFVRTGSGAAGLPAAAVSQVFSAQPGAIVTAQGSGGAYVAQLKSIDTPEPKPDASGMAQLLQRVQADLRNDVLAEFDQGLKRRHSVEIVRSEIDRLF